jgi:multidrug transporter EmrE-like cation transporter
MGASVSRLCCADGHLCQDWRRGRELGFRHADPDLRGDRRPDCHCRATGQFQPLREISAKTWVFLALSGLGTGASWLCYFRALKLGDAARVAPVDKLSIVLVAVFGVVFLSEKLSLLHWLAIAMMTAGAVMLAVL